MSDAIAPDTPPGLPFPGEAVLVTGAVGAIGRRVVRLLESCPDVASVSTLDRKATLDPNALRADVLIHLPFAASAVRRRPGALETDVTRRLLAAATEADIRHLVVLSSATVYGAWPNNPVPITEGAPLRPVTGLAEDGSSWLARALAGGAGVLAPEEDPPAQFVHLDDVVAAIDLARRRRLDGTYNVSPDGWIAGRRLRALAGGKPSVRPPAWFTHWISNLRWRFQRGPIPPGLLPYMTNAWLVANDRLKAEGWQPRVTNEQAYVAGTETRWWQLLTPKRRQELALALAGLLAASVLVTAALLVRGAVRRKRAA